MSKVIRQLPLFCTLYFTVLDCLILLSSSLLLLFLLVVIKDYESAFDAVTLIQIP